MGDPNSYYSLDSPINYDFLDDSNPNLANIFPPNPLGDPITNIPRNDDPIVSDHHNYNNRPNQSQEAGSSRGRESENSQATFLDNSRDTIPPPVWPPGVSPLQCSCCQVLREIIHNDMAGNTATKLEIHGTLGMISHAILEIRDPSASQFHMIDFCRKSIEKVKEYLQQYFNDRTSAGLILVEEPLSIFYQALCVGIQWDEYINNDDDDEQNFSGGEEVRSEERRSRRNLAQQRERARRMTLDDFKDYFHLPMGQASRQMNLCITVLKKICRKYGLYRWPYRKIKPLRRQILELRTILSSNDAEERAKAEAEAEIHKLEQEISHICGGGGGGNN
ncbi:uncharacterized protein [Euphorbia lathyris]|uniref:uncharacterized protein n=1 Tax=Euphorbia lathyris TaxID=212925 RepID=UPI0033132F93